VFGSVEILLLFILLEGDEGDPLSPPEGEATQGEHPLDPFSLFLPSLKRISHQLHEAHRIFMNTSTGEEAKVTAARKSVRTIFQ
jgi:hypothetical protein